MILFIALVKSSLNGFSFQLKQREICKNIVNIMLEINDDFA